MESGEEGAAYAAVGFLNRFTLARALKSIDGRLFDGVVFCLLVLLLGSCLHRGSSRRLGRRTPIGFYLCRILFKESFVCLCGRKEGRELIDASLSEG